MSCPAVCRYELPKNEWGSGAQKELRCYRKHQTRTDKDGFDLDVASSIARLRATQCQLQYSLGLVVSGRDTNTVDLCNSISRERMHQSCSCDPEQLPA